MKLIELIKEEICLQGVTHQALADKIGCKKQQVTQLLSGKNKPRIDTLERVAKALDVEIIIKQHIG